MTSKQSSNYGKRGGRLKGRSSRLGVRKDAMCFPLGKIIRPLESGMKVKIGCGRHGTHPKLQSLVSLELSKR